MAKAKNDAQTRNTQASDVASAEWVMWRPGEQLTAAAERCVIIDARGLRPWQAALAVAQLRNVAAVVAVTTDADGEAVVLWSYRPGVAPGDVVEFDLAEAPPLQTESEDGRSKKPRQGKT